MALISSGIDKVRAFELPAGVWADGSSVGMPRAALVRWHSEWDDKLHQVYVNGRWAGVTVDGEQRQIVVSVPNSFEAPVRIDVFAVEPGQGDRDFGSEIEAAGAQTGRVRIMFLRQQDLPMGAGVKIYSDNGSGVIDYEEPLTDSAIRVWAGWQDKAGFGLSSFAESDFGYDSAGAVGFGMGSFGGGWFGLDADMLQWLSKSLPAGAYKFGVKVFDEEGNASTASEIGPITVIPTAKPAEDMSIVSFDEQTNELMFGISY